MPVAAIALIAAIDLQGGIGRHNALLWTDPKDHAHFRSLTVGHTVLMGRKTWDSLPPRFRPLPGRHNIVLSRDPMFLAPGAELAPSLDAALGGVDPLHTAWIIGGAELYRQSLGLAERLELTEIQANFEADTFFPPFDATQFVRSEGEIQSDCQGRSFRFVTYTRLKGS